MTNRAKALEALKSKIKREKNCDIQISCSDVNGVVNILLDYLAKNDHLKLTHETDGVTYGFVGKDKNFYSMDEEIRSALQDAPRVEVIDGLEDALSREFGSDATLAFIILENSGIDCTDKSIGQVNSVVNAARAYAKLQGKGE